MIQNYGIFWRRDLTFWNQPYDKTGRLQGRQIQNMSVKLGPVVDFRFQSGVYILHEDFKVIYVGQASRLFGRLRFHTRDGLAERWNRFSWFGLHAPKEEDGMWLIPKSGHESPEPDLKAYLNHLEGVLIAVSEPPLNRAGPRFGDKVSQYAQVPLRRQPSPVQSDPAEGAEEDDDRDFPGETSQKRLRFAKKSSQSTKVVR